MTTASARFYALGERAVVIESPPPVEETCQQKIWWLARRLSSHWAVRGVIPGMNNLTVLLDPALLLPTNFLPELEALWQQATEEPPHSHEVRIPVVYGGDAGPDLPDVAHHAKLSPDEVIARHAGADYLVYFLGFQPGFAYLGGLPEELATPRLAEPRLSVPAGSVGIGGCQTGIYPAVTPGGWNLIGRSTVRLFDPSASPPTLLQPGDRVRFVPVEATTCLK
ncbi:5-oxoprolinase subunit PxpB [Crenobacter sp. SG2303]|uniref:5-oxoprolinase subunit PxpB n=1 Tax=Crenobacter oryzisoli TaxID=3056844 RepID=A0ABT7XM51_9NEIS|nr:5-oxoprolinase subunit PxpB [Crenobacter sp. SG2303]MDN0074862.1 5-oxoprolinase subunit PxpB [Crenobacter sp. SG2303]